MANYQHCFMFAGVKSAASVKQCSKRNIYNDSDSGSLLVNIFVASVKIAMQDKATEIIMPSS